MTPTQSTPLSLRSWIAIGVVLVIALLFLRQWVLTDHVDQAAAVAVAPASVPPVTAAAPPVAVTATTFEPVYRSAKTIQGSTNVGVTLVRFQELLQAYATELSIARDKRLTPADSDLLAKYSTVLEHYKVSATLWKLKINAHDDLWKGEIPLEFEGVSDGIDVDGLATTYKIPILTRTLTTGKTYRAFPGDATQRVWLVADATLDTANATYTSANGGR